MDWLSSHRWTCVVTLGLVGLALVCTAGLAGVVWFQLRSPNGRVVAVDRIAYVGPDGNIYVIDRDGGNRVAVTADAEIPTQSGGRLYRFPTWSPDNRWIAFVGIEIGPRSISTNTLYAASVAGGELKPLFSSQESGPFYLYWSPDARQVAFLASEDGGLSLRLAGLDGQTRLLDTGAPFYFTWSPTGQALITHVGGSQPLGRIGRLDITADQPEVLLDRPAVFLSPAWSPTGDAVLFAAELGEEGPALYLADEHGQPQRVLVQYQGAISFAWSPQGDRVAFVETNQPRPAGLGQFAWGSVRVIDRAGGEPRAISTDNALAFFWAPDGRAIAYLTILTGKQLPQGDLMPASSVLQQEGLRLQWHVVTLSTEEDRALAKFVPAPGFLSLLPFFDQYAQSLRLWSPDSAALVYSARDAGGRSGVWVIAADGQTPPQRIADGDLPVWSWK